MLAFCVGRSTGSTKRIISLVPNVTEMLFAIGAGPQVVAVSTYDVEPPEVRSLPTVGALLDPDTEKIISLRPDLVITYGSQSELQAQLKSANIPFFDYRHAGLDHIMATMRELGQRTGHVQQAEKAARSLEAAIDAVKKRVAGKPRPRTLLVFGREPGSLRNIYASAGRGFLHDMLVAAGGEDVLSDIDKESAQINTEMILARRPDVILELNAANRLNDADMKKTIEPWMALSSVPAVKNHRVVLLLGPGLTVPGPRVIQGIERWRRRYTREDPGLLVNGQGFRVDAARAQAAVSARRRRLADDDERSVRSRGDARGPARAARGAGASRAAAAARGPAAVAVLERPVRDRSCGAAIAGFVAEGFTHVAFGDLFLEDVRQYRVDRLAESGLEPLFPIWKTKSTADLAREMIEGGLQARLTCVDPRKLDRSFAGRTFDQPAAARPAGRRRPVRRKRRIPFVCVRWADVRPSDSPYRLARSSIETASCSRTCTLMIANR